MNERLNVRRMLAPETSEDYLTFDAEKKLGAYKEAIYAWFSQKEDEGIKGKIDEHIDEMAKLHQLFPNEPVILSEDTRTAALENLKRLAIGNISDNDVRAIRTIAALRQLAPEQAPKATEEGWKRIEIYLERILAGTTVWPSYVAENIPLVYPEKKLNPRLKERLRNEIEQMKDTPTTCACFMRRLRVLFPEEKVTVPKAMWTAMQEDLSDNIDVQSWGDVVNLAYDMQIIAADEVVVGEKGLEIRSKKDELNQQVRPIPEAPILPQ